MASFDRTYFTQMAYGGQGGNSIWHYFDINGDNVASIASGVVNTQYFKRAFTLSGVLGRPGDIILCMARDATTEATKQGSANHSTPVMFSVPTAWDSNGASVIRAIGALEK